LKDLVELVDKIDLGRRKRKRKELSEKTFLPSLSRLSLDPLTENDGICNTKSTK